MLPKKRRRINQDIATVFMIAVGLLSGIIMILFSILRDSSFLAIMGVTVSFWSILLLFFTPTKHEFLALLRASASASGSNIERSILQFDLTEKGVYLPPQYLRNFQSSLVFVPAKPDLPLPSVNEVSDKLFSEKETKDATLYLPGIFLTPPGLALSLMFEDELGLSFRKIPLQQMQEIINKLFKKLKFADNINIQIYERKITVEITGSVFNALCYETRNSQPRAHSQVGCILASAFACAFAKASDKPITIQKDILDTNTKTLLIEYRMEEE